MQEPFLKNVCANRNNPTEMKQIIIHKRRNGQRSEVLVVRGNGVQSQRAGSGPWLKRLIPLQVKIKIHKLKKKKKRLHVWLGLGFTGVKMRVTDSGFQDFRVRLKQGCVTFEEKESKLKKLSWSKQRLPGSMEWPSKIWDHEFKVKPTSTVAQFFFLPIV